MAGMKFLNLKGWHPSNARNQKRIWIAEQKAAQTAQAERDAAADVRKHAETQRFQALAAAKGDAESARRSEQLQVGFLYAPPPGLEKVDEKVAQEMTEDDAVREFRRKMEKRSTSTAAHGEDVQRPLERYVGRRPDEMLTIKEQVERFPFLKDAPVEGDYASNVKVNFKPMGRTLRNVKCMRCSEWGHQSGDRECALRDANPHDADRQAREDPMATMAKLKREGQLVLRQRVLPLEMRQTTTMNETSGQEYAILLSDDESIDPEKAFLAGLSTKEKKSLLKKLRKQSREEEEEADTGKKKKRRRDNDDSEEDENSIRSRRDRSSQNRRRTERTVMTVETTRVGHEEPAAATIGGRDRGHGQERDRAAPDDDKAKASTRAVAAEAEATAGITHGDGLLFHSVQPRPAKPGPVEGTIQTIEA